MEMDEDVTISRENGIVVENEEKPVENILVSKPIEEVLSQENTKNNLQNGTCDLYSLEGTSDVLDVDFDMTAADSEDSWYEYYSCHLYFSIIFCTFQILCFIPK